jgi:SAM-dependent methyltransferase
MELIDFGCGSKPYAPLFEGRGAHYRGADFATGNLERGDVAIGAEGSLPLADASVDLLVSFQVLEHVRDLDTYLGEARRVLRPGGRMILSTHGNWLFHPHPEDHRRWTSMGLRSEIEARGFEMLELTPLVGPLGWTTMMRLTCFAASLRKVPIVGRAFADLLALVMNLKAAVEEKVTPGWVTADNACVYLTVSRPV